MKRVQASSIQESKIIRVSNQGKQETMDDIAVEAPLEIRLKKENEIDGQSISVTMRTPGSDDLLATGFLLSEGIVRHQDKIKSFSTPQENVIELVIGDETKIDLDKSERNFYTTSSCGVCGKSSIEAIKVKSEFHVGADVPNVDKSVLFSLQEKIKSVQKTFTQTGGIHAATLFSEKGDLISIHEDVGRHNAMDKLVGYCWAAGLLPLYEHILLLSGRASFELIQKATMVGIPVIASVGAPSSLAIELAAENNHTLVGFLKPDRFNIYTGHERIR